MSYGSSELQPWVLDEAESHVLIKKAWGAGTNFFDTADIYSHAESEKVLGNALKKFNIPRNQVVIATKVFFPLSDNVSQGIFRQDAPSPKLINRGGLSRKHILEAFEKMLYREEEREMLPLLVDQGIACIPWSPLARGVLSGKKKGVTTRSTSDINRDRFLSNQNQQDDIIVERVVKIAERMTKENELNKDGVIRKIISPSMVALAWIYSKKVVTAPIVGIGKEEYLNDALEALKLCGRI
ncbi:hypothetical protein HK098_000190 [Nowakowskiella sp. JEL0407]|nr:hypothetical protein HK098_000190 [Nowakowskiella sp. JEL0407]